MNNLNLILVSILSFSCVSIQWNLANDYVSIDRYADHNTRQTISTSKIAGSLPVEYNFSWENENTGKVFCEITSVSIIRSGSLLDSSFSMDQNFFGQSILVDESNYSLNFRFIRDGVVAPILFGFYLEKDFDGISPFRNKSKITRRRVEWLSTFADHLYIADHGLQMPHAGNSTWLCNHLSNLRNPGFRGGQI